MKKFTDFLNEENDDEVITYKPLLDKNLMISFFNDVMIKHCGIKNIDWEPKVTDKSTEIRVKGYELRCYVSGSLGFSTVPIFFFSSDEVEKFKKLMQEFPNNIKEYEIQEEHYNMGPNDIMSYLFNMNNADGISKSTEFLKDFYHRHRGEKLVGELGV